MSVKTGNWPLSLEAELLQLFVRRIAASLHSGQGISRRRQHRKGLRLPHGGDYQLRWTGADILLVILTDRLKPSFCVSGFEVGCFSRSRWKSVPRSTGSLALKNSSISIGAANQTTLEYLQAIKLDEDQIPQTAKRHDVIGPYGVAREARQTPFFTLLADISATADSVLGKHGARVAGSVSRMNSGARSPVSSAARAVQLHPRPIWDQRASARETYPERKIVLHSDAPLLIRARRSRSARNQDPRWSREIPSGVFGFPRGEKPSLWMGTLSSRKCQSR